jgi:hypothetical protein
VADFPRAQAFADRFASLDWVKWLDRLARAVNPLLPELLAPTYYWVTAQSEYATDVVFERSRDLQDLMPRLVRDEPRRHRGAEPSSSRSKNWRRSAPTAPGQAVCCCLRLASGCW